MELPKFLQKKAPTKLIVEKPTFCPNCHRANKIPEVLKGKELQTTNERIVLGCHYCRSGKVVLELIEK